MNILLGFLAGMVVGATIAFISWQRVLLQVYAQTLAENKAERKELWVKSIGNDIRLNAIEGLILRKASEAKNLPLN